MSAYRNVIVECTGCAPEDAADVESMMRISCRTLDGLSRGRFAKLARASWETVQAARRMPVKPLRPAQPIDDRRTSFDALAIAFDAMDGLSASAGGSPGQNSDRGRQRDRRGLGAA